VRWFGDSGLPDRSCLAAPENKPASITRTKASIARQSVHLGTPRAQSFLTGIIDNPCRRLTVTSVKRKFTRSGDAWLLDAARDIAIAGDV